MYQPPERLHVGSVYYPEHWPEERWPEEVRLMREAGVTVVRMANLPGLRWSRLMASFHFEWLDTRHGAAGRGRNPTVLGTPTAAPPAWLAPVNPDAGRRRVWRARPARQPLPLLRHLARVHDASPRIVAGDGRALRPDPNVIGWQLDNEYSRVCYCDRCRACSSISCRRTTARSMRSTGTGPPPIGARPTPPGSRSRSRSAGTTPA